MTSVHRLIERIGDAAPDRGRDADIENAFCWTVQSAVSNAGQRCSSARLISDTART